MNLLELLLSLFRKSAKVESEIKQPKVYITLEDYKMGRDVEYPGSWLPEYEKNATLLLEKINALLNDLNYEGKVSVSSGFRPPQINKTLNNAAKKSYHMIGMACDLLDDKNQSLGKLILKNHPLLKKHGLWLEDLSSTIGKNTNWVHLDIGKRSERDINSFKV